MKTLDEVIKGLETCTESEGLFGQCAECPYDGEDKCEHNMEVNALHYLKEYKKMCDYLDERFKRRL